MNLDKLKEHFKKNIAIYIAIIIAAIPAIIGYFWTPRQGYDLYEYYSWMQKMNTFNMQDLVSYFIYRGEPIVMLYFYVIAKIGNFQLLQVLPTFLFYFIAFYMLIDYAKQKEISYKKVALVAIVLIALVEYIYIMGCFRYTLAYIIFALALYLNYMKKKKGIGIALLYIIPCFIHLSAFIFLALRIIALIKNKKVLIAIISIIAVVLIFPQPFVEFAKQILGENSLINKINYYFIESRSEIQLSLQYFFRIAQNLFLILISLYYDWRHKKENPFKDYNKFLNLMLIVVILSTPYQAMLVRFTDMLLMLMLLKMLALLHSLKEKKEKCFFYGCLWLFIIAGIRIQIPVFGLMYMVQ